jgi:hypothetical protein
VRKTNLHREGDELSSPNGCFGGVEGGAPGFVDVAARARHCLTEFAFDGKLARDFAEVAG